MGTFPKPRRRRWVFSRSKRLYRDSLELDFFLFYMCPPATKGDGLHADTLCIYILKVLSALHVPLFAVFFCYEDTLQRHPCGPEPIRLALGIYRKKIFNVAV